MPEIESQTIHFDPIGTLEELQANNLSPATFASCSKPEGRGGNVGCRHWKSNCTMSYKGKLGPANHAVRLVKPPSATVDGEPVAREIVCSCVFYHDHIEQWRANKWAVRITGSEKRVAPSGGRTQFIMTGTKAEAKPLNPAAPAFVPLSNEESEKEIAPFPRPSDNPKLRMAQHYNRLFEVDTREQERVDYERAVGSEVTEFTDLRQISGYGKSTKADEGRPAQGDQERPNRQRNA